MYDRRTLFFFCLNFLLGMGFIFGFVPSNTLLVGRVGAEQLFEVYLLSGLFLLPLWGFVYAVVDRFSRTKIFHITYAISAALVVVCFFVLRTNPSALWIYVGIRILFYALYFLTCSQLCLLIGQFFTYFETKRRYPYFVIADTTGQLVAGILLSTFAQLIGTTNIILIWALIFIICIVIVANLQRLVPSNFLQSTINEVHTNTKSAEVVRWSRANISLLIALFLFWFVHSFLCYGTDYVYNTVTKHQLITEDKLTSFFGYVASISSIFLIAYQLVFARLFIERFGLVGSVWGLTLCAAVPIFLFKIVPNIYTIALAEGVIYLLLDFVASGRLNVVLNVFADEQRGRVKVFAEGIGCALGSISVYLVSKVVGFDANNFSSVLVGVVLVYVVLYPLFFSKTYKQHLLSSFCTPSVTLLTNIIQALGERYYEQATPRLFKLLQQTKLAELKKTIIVSLGRIQGRSAFKVLVKAFPLQDPSTQMEILKALTKFRGYEALLMLLKLTKYNKDISEERRFDSILLLAKWAGEKALPHLVELLLDPNPRIQANAIEAIAILKDPTTASLLLDFLNDENLRVRANTVIALYPFKKCRSQAEHVLNKLVESKDQEVLRSGIYIIAMLKLQSYREYLINISSVTSDKVTALFAAFALGRIEDKRFIQIFLSSLVSTDLILSKNAQRLGKKLPRSSVLLLLETAYKELSPDQCTNLCLLFNETIPSLSLIEEIRHK